ncbi:thiamine pyrophosphate-dependent dehydrogenase E1 component subunit alpha [Streptomyces fuscichromogenes]|uniref:Pyruvate dehydrogenase E1 component subunit alpha n=1 Tax=Streptomyces fuscichromogenes TaxID=1324013 RepID=A0A918CPC9_9ACTN|nr:thiamine pyrophosphate-dependent dehydrogenase E1 component subunit alpha [Streptomyces fuscichromogenes]GGM97929.1 pyruvate dehydrogenase E1 component subunit alpha [Streptomyces fuscichromogenes]
MAVTTPKRPVPAAEQQRRMYELMTLMKLTDDRLAKGIGSGEFLSVYWPHRGQEAVAAALGVVLRSTDQLVTTYRGLHDHIGKGVPVEAIIGELLGKETAPGMGKGGTSHLAYPEAGAMLSTGIVGAGLPIAVGLGLAVRQQGLDRVVAVSFGDGATNTGSFHEAMNMAAVLDVPVVFVCQNNLYGEKTPVERTMKVATVAERAAAYGMPGLRVDGNDPDAVFGSLAEAVERTRAGGGPVLVECVTFRFRGHSYGDSQSYMPRERLAAALERDPVPAYRRRLLDMGVCSESELLAVEATAADVVDQAVKKCTDAPEPSTERLLDHRYVDDHNMPA